MYDNKIEIQEDYLDYEFLDDWQNYNAPQPEKIYKIKYKFVGSCGDNKT